jgi:hypothetical protein
MTEKQFKQLVKKWAKQFKVPLPKLEKDNFLDCTGSVNPSMNTYKYNFEYIKSRPFCEIIGHVFHELGHFFYKHKYLTIENEYMAERFKLDKLKKYYPDYYKKTIKRLKQLLRNSGWKIAYPIHYNAYRKIKEYRNGKTKKRRKKSR